MFDFLQAVSTDELDALFQLRYEVYCVEKQFLPSATYPTKREQDELDAHSVHFFARTKCNGSELAGCFRLILQNPSGFPCEEHFDLEWKTPDPPRTVELSRLIVAPSFRSNWQIVLMGLVKEVFIYTQEKEIHHCYAVLEKSLLTLLNRIGIHFEIIGGEKQYFNTPNYPTVIHATRFEKDLFERNQLFYNFVTASKETSIAAL